LKECVLKKNLPPTRAWFLAVALILTMAGCTRTNAPVASPAEFVQVYYFPEEAETVAALSPEDLRRIRSGFVELDDSVVAAEAWETARADVGDTTGRWADVRWGLRILDAHRKVLAEYYVDRRGTLGFSGARRVGFAGHLRDWLRARLGLFAN
jgi:hypothetical protein